MNDYAALLPLMAAAALGWVHQATLMAPTSVRTWKAYAALGLATVVLYYWATPDSVAQFRENWRLAIVGIISFFLTARGVGIATVEAKLAPATDSK